MTMADPYPTAENLTDWYDAGPADAIDLDAAIVLPLKPPVAVYHIEDGYFASDDTCSHSEYSLGDGWIEDGTVECELHAAKFDIKTGEALTLPATEPVATYPVVVVEGTVYVDLRGREGCVVEKLRG
ncbi:non-heme iron oxygenase ferredoxin subunit [Nocardioides sp. BP30]|uniref:non-heme iron oxygenase ferredoxin subunit n=1 Tax=Nocardioides sp. BP30 TaxID=3036374 RepID=UPI0024695C1E|nr:non-heme iron oxygenase ferredoxin subunit [Nocardioides sp. BP30]WGL50792.1 non-heme iron oxygenase ferredoxin subunit [Nocardioides sp. BP30]